MHCLQALQNNIFEYLGKLTTLCLQRHDAKVANDQYVQVAITFGKLSPIVFFMHLLRLLLFRTNLVYIDGIGTHEHRSYYNTRNSLFVIYI